MLRESGIGVASTEARQILIPAVKPKEKDLRVDALNEMIDRVQKRQWIRGDERGWGISSGYSHCTTGFITHDVVQHPGVDRMYALMYAALPVRYKLLRLGICVFARDLDHLGEKEAIQMFNDMPWRTERGIISYYRRAIRLAQSAA